MGAEWDSRRAPVAPDDERVREARSRWGRAGDRLWPVAMVDGVSYQHAARLVGVLLTELRARVSTFDELLDLDADPSPLLAGLGDDGAAAGAPGQRLVVDCALGMRGSELAAAAERDRRTAVIAAAREAGAEWVELERPPPEAALCALRSVELHLASGTALLATADPYAEPPFALEEVVLDRHSGAVADDPETGTEPGGGRGKARGRGARPGTFTDRESWLAARAHRRAEIASRLDNEDRDSFV